MPSHHIPKNGGHEDHRHDKKGPGKGPKEKEIAATLTAATVALAGPAQTYPSLDAAGDAVAQIYARMFDLVSAGAPHPR
jgi:hypothetical protein